MIGVLLYVMKDCTDRECAKEIHGMRRQLRSHFKDIRTNADVVRYVWDIIGTVAEDYDTGFFIEPPDGPKPTRATRKRRHPDSDDEHAQPASSPAKTPVKGRPRGRPRKKAL